MGGSRSDASDWPGGGWFGLELVHELKEVRVVG